MYVAAWQDDWFIQIDNVHLFSEQTIQDGFAWKDRVTHNVTNTKILSDLHHYSLFVKKDLSPQTSLEYWCTFIIHYNMLQNLIWKRTKALEKDGEQEWKLTDLFSFKTLDF